VNDSRANSLIGVRLSPIPRFLRALRPFIEPVEQLEKVRYKSQENGYDNRHGNREEKPQPKKDWGHLASSVNTVKMGVLYQTMDFLSVFKWTDRSPTTHFGGTGERFELAFRFVLRLHSFQLGQRWY
jgi:hypothetical protein